MLRVRVLVYRIFFILMVLVPFLLWMTTVTEVAEGAEFGILRKAAIEGGSYQGTNKEYFLELDRTGERLQHTTKMIINVDLFCTYLDGICMFWDNEVDAKASSSQYRSVAWDYRLGWALGKKVDIGWWHRSNHELDRKSSNFARFELENVLFIQFKWHEKPRG